MVPTLTLRNMPLKRPPGAHATDSSSPKSSKSWIAHTIGGASTPYHSKNDPLPLAGVSARVIACCCSIVLLDVRREIDRREHEQPDRVDEMPIHGEVLNRNMAMLVERTPPRAHLHPQADEQPDQHVRAVQPGETE